MATNKNWFLPKAFYWYFVIQKNTLKKRGEILDFYPSSLLAFHFTIQIQSNISNSKYAQSER